MNNAKILIMVPTYNESDNIELLFNEIIDLGLDVDFLFIDDNSPDGTGEIIDTLVEDHTNVNVMHRSGKLGIGSAHIDGIKWAYDHKYNKLLTMDCDFTHQPKYIPDFIKNSENYDIVVGSRHLSNKCIEDWDLMRKIMTSMGHIVTKHLLNMKYDATGAYRLYRLDKIPRNIFDLIRSNDYPFFFESLYILNVNDLSIKEIGIALPARNLGHSKMTKKHIIQWGKYLLYMFILTLFNKKRFRIHNEGTHNE